jgi:hypothetical protein
MRTPGIELEFKYSIKEYFTEGEALACGGGAKEFLLPGITLRGDGVLRLFQEGWKAGLSLHTIGRAFGKPHTSIHCLLSHHGGVAPAARRPSLLILTASEREDISRGLASGSSLRDIANVWSELRRR